MEGFIEVRIAPWLRRLLPRTVAIIPAVFPILTAGDKGTYQLLILSQVILSLQLPFAVIPLVQFTSDRRRMGDFANRLWVRILAWIAAALIVGLNVRLVYTEIQNWIHHAPRYQTLILAFLIPILSCMMILLLWVTGQPFLERYLRFKKAGHRLPATAETVIPTLTYRDILVPLDHSNRDPIALSHAAALARMHDATVHILHAEEGVTSNIYGEASETDEVGAGREYFASILQRLEAEAIRAELHVS